MTFLPIGKPEEDVAIVNQLPQQYAYATHQLKGAAVRSIVWKEGAVMIQSASIGAVTFHLYQIYVKEHQLLTVSVPEAITALWLVMKGNALVYTEGVGQHKFHEGECLLAHSPATTEHYMRLAPGMYQFACITLTQQQVQHLATVNAQLAHFSACVSSGERRSVMQLTVSGLPGRDALLSRLIAIDYHNPGSCVRALSLADSLLNGYVLRLRQLMRSRKMNNGMVPLATEIQTYIHKHFHKHLTTGVLAEHFGVSDFTIYTAFFSITNQTVKQYIIEQQLLKACDYLRRKGASVKCCACEIGMSETCLLRYYKRRFGCAPSALRRRKLFA
ncbi:AraC-like DNA-binding protein [Filimonas zeae]|uniref:HTH araC/xylS-type domain-containing protein n=1 Tax=Filimonas zeae TaxID=1737353 RepID=A0A917MY34_9BACT|nr:AraC family transcriptional regulator [Filimonas zeae]MDR6340918.1 AraC-like DNA-binding protein [Filimonas zeae]GGH77950.1 hypothetical protein GCM10011379_45070 [Filimonas zeae]